MKKKLKISSQIKKRIKKDKGKKVTLWSPPEGTNKFLISTGSTLVDLAITGRRFKGGGIPMGIFVEIFGGSGRGKTAMLLEMAGDCDRQKGDYLFIDPEARVNKYFAKVFDFNLDDNKYKKPATVEEAFALIKKWNPEGKGPHCIFMDSLAAFASKEEEAGKGDEYSGARKAKEFSQEFRQICRIIEEKEYLFVATNQIRQNLGAAVFGKKTKATGGEAPRYYASLRLELKKPKQFGNIVKEKTIRKVKHKEIIGVHTDVFVEKSSISIPHKTGSMRILFDYGIDSIVPDLVYIKRNTKSTIYILKEENIGDSIDKAVKYIEHSNSKIMRKRIKMLKEDVIDLWVEIQKQFVPDRKRKLR